ncbi:MAG: hypothetical protein K2K84_03895 [Muribaculaceae bacterium]|nr:hypothetical protein [Muribaculaceae bacterium]
MKKISLILLMIAAMMPVACKKKTSYTSESSRSYDDTEEVAKIDEPVYNTDRVSETRNVTNSTDDVDRLIKLFDRMGDELMANPSNAGNISKKYERLANQFSDDTPLTNRDIKRLNNAVMEMMEKVVYGTLVSQGMDPEELSSSELSRIEKQFDQMSRQINELTASSRTLGEYMMNLGNILGI